MPPLPKNRRKAVFLCPKLLPEVMCVSVEIPNHQDILDKIHQHDLRLTRVEVTQASMASEITEQTGRLNKMAERLDKLYEKVAELHAAVSGLDGKMKLILALVGIGIPVILGLEIWAGLRVQE